MAKDKYTIMGVTKSIKFTSRASIKIGESYYTVEACEERVLPVYTGEDMLTSDSLPHVDIAMERQALWDCVNTECDNQIQDILQTYKR